MTDDHREHFVPWMPTYIEVMHDQGDRFGFPNLAVDAAKYPLITARMTYISERFFQRYFERQINKETLERWQIRLQNTFDEVAPKYERAYRLYDGNTATMDQDLVKGWKNTFNNEATDSGSDQTNTDGTTKNIDTPDSAINESQNPDYADSLTKVSSQTVLAHGKKTTTGGDVTHKETGASVIESVNLSINSWMDIDTWFIREFENNFLNIFWS